MKGLLMKKIYDKTFFLKDKCILKFLNIKILFFILLVK